MIGQAQEMFTEVVRFLVSEHAETRLTRSPAGLDELDLVVIGPLPTWVWYQDMADFADGVTDERAAPQLARALQGKGAFRRFKDELREEHPDLLPAW